MANTADFNKKFDNIRLAELEYLEVNSKHILESIDFPYTEDKLLCKDIIEHLETTAAEEIQNGKCVQIPYIGCLRKNPLKKTLEQNVDKLRAARKHLNKEDYKEFTADIFKKRKQELKEEDYYKAKIKEIKNRYKKEYEQYYTKLGPAYANLFVFTRLKFSPVEFNQEFEDLMQNFNNE